MKLDTAVNHIVYNGTLKPTESVSDDRWRAMVAYIMREVLN